MAFRLPGLSSTVNTGLSSLTNSLKSSIGSITSSVSSGNIGNGLNSALRNASSQANQFTSGLSSANFSDLSSNLRSVSTNLNSALSSELSNVTGNLNAAFNRVNANLGSLQDLSVNPNRITQAIESKFSNFPGLTSGLSQSLTQNLSSAANFSDMFSLTNPATVLQSSFQEAIAAVGGEFSKATQYIESVKNDPWSFYANLAGGEFDMGTSISGAGVVPTSSRSNRIENPLRKYNTVNYIFTLGVLDRAQFNSPDSYRNSGGFKYIVVRSGGGERGFNYAKRVQTDAELRIPGHAEYFIEDVEISAVVAPNSNTGTALGTNVSFTVIEPYSLGKFLESCMVAAQKAGYQNYVQAPFCLKIEFVGWDENGETAISETRPFYLPIKLLNTKFDVTTQGSTYQVKAVPYNEMGLSDEANKVPTQINATGATPSEVLENGRTSVTTILNDRIEELENKKLVKGYDRYIIAFPKSKNELMEAIRSQNVDLAGLSATLKAEEQERIRQGRSSQVPPSDQDTKTTATPVISTQAPSTYLYLKAYASDVTKMNEIGRSILLEDSRDGSPQQVADAASVQDAATQTNRRQNAESQVAEKSRSYQFTQRDKITNIIESVIQNSKYARDVATEPSVKGFKKWFRIETLVFLDDNTEVEASLGRPRRTYVFAVHPYTPHEASSLAPGEKPTNITNLKSLVKKEYNYYYTGKNEDIINFDINFNNAFFSSLRSDMAQGRESVTHEIVATGQQQGSQIAPSKAGATSNHDPGAPTELTSPNPTSSGGLPKPTSVGTETRIAQMFHERLLSNQVDMISAELEIWGDPYFIPTDLGNYSATPADPAISQDGAMNYMRNEVYIMLNFKTPIDYELNGSTMLFPETVKPFSGLYKVLSVKNTFSNGQFKQMLKMVRMRGQNDEGTTENKLPIQTAPRETRLDSGSSSANLPADPAAAAAQQAQVRAAAAANAATTQTIRVSNAVTSGPNVVRTQELLTTGAIVNGVRTVTNTPVQSVDAILRDNPELRQFVVRNPADRTTGAVDNRREIFPINIGYSAGSVDPGLARAATASSLSNNTGTLMPNGQRMRTLTDARRDAAARRAARSTGTRPPVGPQ